MRACIRRTLPALVAVLSLSFSGCGPSIPKTYPVKAKVVAKKGRPFDSGTITFGNLKDDTIKGDAEIQKDGTFTLKTKMYGKERAGLPEGEYKVLIDNPTTGKDGQLVLGFIEVKEACKIEPRDNDVTVEAERLK